MAEVVTLAERKAREADRRRDAADAVMAELRDYARSRGGRFLVFGSVAKDQVRHTSDFDVIIDFPEALEREAWDFVEDVCRKHDLAEDIHSLRSTRRAFLDRVRAHAKVLE